jgi:hypothetical protein
LCWSQPTPLLVDHGYSAEPGKLAASRRLVEGALKGDSKVILSTSFIDHAEWLAGQIFDIGSVVVHGDKSIVDQNVALDAFKNDPACRILVATPASAKEGLTLTVTNHVIFFERSFSLDDYLRARRIHPLGVLERNRQRTFHPARLAYGVAGAVEQGCLHAWVLLKDNIPRALGATASHRCHVPTSPQRGLLPIAADG